jgi:hypothetical protein
MEQFDPNIPGLMEGALARVAVTDPQPFVGGVGNHVVDPTKEFKLTVEWEIFGQLVPLWLTALAGNWNVSVYAESLGGGPEVRLETVHVPTTDVKPCTVNTLKANCTKFSAEITVPPNTLEEHKPGTDVGGIYKLVAAVFLNSNIAGVPGFDLVGYSEGPIIQAEKPA